MTKNYLHVTVTVSGLYVVLLVSVRRIFVVQKVFVFGDLSKEKIKELLTKSRRKLSNAKWSESHRCEWRNQMDKPPADTSVWTDTAPSPAASSPSGTSAGIPTVRRNPSASAKF